MSRDVSPRGFHNLDKLTTKNNHHLQKPAFLSFLIFLLLLIFNLSSYYSLQRGTGQKAQITFIVRLVLLF